MALVLTGVVNGMRPVGGKVASGPRKGETWEFLSMEITDPRFGKVYSCQLRSNDKQFKDMTELKTVTEQDQGGKSTQVQKRFLKDNFDYTGHKVKVTIAGITAGEREIDDKDGTGSHTIIQIRTQITNIRDLGEPEDEE